MQKKIKLSVILKLLNLKTSLKKDFFLNNVSSIDSAKKGDITLCLSSKYLDLLLKTEASICVTTQKFKKYVQKNMSKMSGKWLYKSEGINRKPNRHSTTMYPVQ